MKLDPIAHDYLHALDNARNVILGQLNDALGHLRMIGRHADGYGTQSDDEGRGTAELTSTERAANLRYRIGLDLEELRDTVHAFHSLNGDLLDLIRRAWGHEQQIAEQRPLCRDGGHGKDGALEWHDPDCFRLATSNGLCDMHRMRWVRWKRANGLDTRGDYAA